MSCDDYECTCDDGLTGWKIVALAAVICTAIVLGIWAENSQAPSPRQGLERCQDRCHEIVKVNPDYDPTECLKACKVEEDEP